VTLLRREQQLSFADLYTCLDQVEEGDELYASGTLELACQVTIFVRISLFGWPHGEGCPGVPGFTIIGGSSVALEFAAAVTMEAVALTGATALKVRHHVQCSRVAHCQFTGRGKGVGCDVGDGAAVHITDCTFSGFKQAVLAQRDAEVLAQRVCVSDCSQRGFDLAGAARCVLRYCSATRTPLGFYLDCEASALDGCCARECGQGIVAEFPSYHVRPGSDYRSLLTTAHSMTGFVAERVNGVGVTFCQGVGADLTGSIFKHCSGGAVLDRGEPVWRCGNRLPKRR
jgi:hypothetical protein